MTDVSLLAEGDLDVEVLKRLLSEIGNYTISSSRSLGGKQKLKNLVLKYNEAARFFPYILMVDLDNDNCPPGLIEDWLPHGRSPNLLFRVPVRAVEAWLLADREGLAPFLGVARNKIPTQPDKLDDPKQILVNVARGSRKPIIREDIVPDSDSTSKVGINYNARLTQFVWQGWNVERACKNSSSLQRTYDRLHDFELQM